MLTVVAEGLMLETPFLKEMKNHQVLRNSRTLEKTGELVIQETFGAVIPALVIM